MGVAFVRENAMQAKVTLWAATIFLARISGAEPLMVSSGNASITVDPGSVFGLSSYTLNGTEQIFEQWFWYRQSSFPYEQPLNTLPLLSSSAAENRIQLSFASPSLGVDLGYQLNGTAAGDNFASLRETVTLRNFTGMPLPLAWYMETDFDLGGFGGQDVINGGLGGILQTDGTTVLSVISSLTPDAFQAAPFPVLFLSLTDFSATNLNNSGLPFGPGDGTFAYQWSLVIPANGSITYSIDKNFIPEPGTAMLCIVGLSLWTAARVRRTSAEGAKKCNHG
jgi:hypothetical protein